MYSWLLLERNIEKMRPGYRLVFCIIAWIGYLISFNLYVWNLTNPVLLPEVKKLWYCYTTGLILTFYTIDSWNGYDTFMHEQIGKLIMITVIINFVLIALTHHGIVNEPTLLIITYNAIWLTIAAMVFISSWKNGLFNK